MSKVYKCWTEIERYDDETEEHANITNECTYDGDFAEPVLIGEFNTLDKAVEFAESYCTDGGRIVMTFKQAEADVGALVKDEYHYLMYVRRHLDGKVTDVLCTIYVHPRRTFEARTWAGALNGLRLDLGLDSIDDGAPREDA